MGIVKVDMLTQDPDTGEFVVYLNEDGPWPETNEGWADTLHRIQERVFDAVHLVLEGAVAEKFPQLEGTKGRIQVNCQSGVPTAITELVEDLRAYLGKDPRYVKAMAASRHVSALRVVTGAEVGPA